MSDWEPGTTTWKPSEESLVGDLEEIRRLYVNKLTDVEEIHRLRVENTELAEAASALIAEHLRWRKSDTLWALVVLVGIPLLTFVLGLTVGRMT
jgi:hypothetical protein